MKVEKSNNGLLNVSRHSISFAAGLTPNMLKEIEQTNVSKISGFLLKKE